MPTLTLNEQSIEAAPGETILAAARRAGVAIPTLCLDARLKPAGDCRLCAVEVDGAPHPVTACTAFATDGMAVRTESNALTSFRRQLVSWMAQHVSPSAYAGFPDKELHQLMGALGVAPTGAELDSAAIDLSHPYLRVDMSQCVSCYRCVRICEELQGQSVWHVLDRGEDVRIVPDSGTTLAESSCVGCGACADTCPTSAITDRVEPQQVEQWTRTTCAYCGVGCELEAGVAEGRIVRARPVVEAPVSKGHLCVKGRYAFGFNHAPDRLREPLLRSGDAWAPTTWDQALGFAADGLRRIIFKHGPSAIGVLGSARATNEDNYLIQKFARVVLGANNVDSCARVCHTPTAAAMKAMLGTGAATNSYDDIELARTILIAGANPTENHPIVGARIRHRVKSGQAQLILIDPRATELSPLAAYHLRPQAGTDIALFNAMAHVIVSEGLADETFIAARVAELDAFRAFIAAWTPDRAAAICGVPAELISGAARLYAQQAPAMAVHGLGLTEHTQGTESVMVLVNLALLTGNIGRRGAGINPLRGQNNVQGAAQMGCDPAILTGSVAIEERRALFEEVWNAVLPRDKGLDLLGMIDAAAAGRLKALIVVGYDILPTLANLAATDAALAKLDLVIVLDIFMSETAAKFGHVVLPAASAFEKDGTFMNAERRVQRVRAATPPPGAAQPDWRIVAELARRMGRSKGFAFESAEEIWNEIRAVWPEARGITYPRLEQGGLQWPCLDEADPGLAVLHAQRFAKSVTAPLARIDYAPTPEVVTAEYPLLMSTGRTLYHFNAGTMTMRTPNLDLRPTDTLEMSPCDAAARDLCDGEQVRVESRHGAASLQLEITDRAAPGQVFATFHDPRTALNALTSPHRDRIVHAPEYKVTAVAVRRATP